MTESATGIILRTQSLTETSLIINWLTPNFGRIATVAKGARRPKSPFSGKLDLFYEADFSLNRSRRSELHTLREVSLRQTNGALRDDIFKLHQAAYGAAFIVQTTESETPLPGVFDLFQKYLACLCAREPSPQLVFALELKMLQELGLEPDWHETSLSAGTLKVAQTLLERDFAGGFGLKLADTQISEMRQFLHGFVIYHVGKVPRGRAQALSSKYD
ncbi:MAG TPA: DNA repair protein RecO [Pseudomonadales bacterium]|nr:DNA repair protein RecO [Pseudomonadales bacterium]